MLTVRLFIILKILLQKVMAEKSSMPVILLDPDKAMKVISKESNPFHKISKSKFSELIHDATVHSEAVIIFVEDVFCAEDIARKDKDGSAFSYLSGIVQEEQAKYYPAVIEPYKLLVQEFEPRFDNIFYLSEKSKLDIMPTLKYIYIHFKDRPTERRIEALRRHDKIIKKVYSVVRQMTQGPIIAFYTGKVNPTHIHQMHFIPIKPIPIPKDLGVMVVSPGALFRFSGVYATSPNRRALFNQLPFISGEKWSQRSLSTKMTYSDFELEFNFVFKDSGWNLDDVLLLETGKEVGRTRINIGAPYNMSYVCAEPLAIVNKRDGNVITISQYQVQPRTDSYGSLRRHANKKLVQDDEPTPEEEASPEGETTTEEPKPPPNEPSESDPNFGPAVNCSPYCSISIITSLIVTFICAIILTGGVIAMMSIKGNDRYEDPLSKPLVHQEM